MPAATACWVRGCAGCASQRKRGARLHLSSDSLHSTTSVTTQDHQAQSRRSLCGSDRQAVATILVPGTAAELPLVAGGGPTAPWLARIALQILMEVVVEDLRVAASSRNQVGLRVQRSVLVRATAEGIPRESGDTVSQRPPARRPIVARAAVVISPTAAAVVSQSAGAVKRIKGGTRTTVCHGQMGAAITAEHVAVLVRGTLDGRQVGFQRRSLVVGVEIRTAAGEGAPRS